MGARKPWLWIVLAVVALALATGAFALRGLPAYADIAAGYVAQQTCTCRFVSSRSETSCLADFPEDAMKHIHLTVDATAKRVRAATLFGLFHASAVYDDRFGCRLEN
ncbi:MAG: hypothetical protein ABUL55_01565 [Pseudomonadota bacterium]